MKISQKQRQIISWKPQKKKIVILNGATGTGKSWAINLKWYGRLINANPGDIFLLCGNTGESLYKNVVIDLMKFDQGINDLMYNRHPGLITTRYGAQCFCVGINNEGSERRLQGGSVKEIYFDEATKYPRSSFNMALARGRYEENGRLVPGVVYMTCNADVPLHYLKTDYIDKADQVGVEVVYFYFSDNPIMSQEYTDSLRKRFSGVFYQRMVENKWCNAEGIIYDKFDAEVHVIDVIPYEKIKEYIIGIDWGYENPLCVLLIGIDYDDRYYICDELYLRNQLIDKNLVEMIKKWGKHITAGYADPSRPDYISMLSEMSKIDIFPADNDVIEGIQEVQRRLVKGDDGHYKLYIYKGCVNTLNEIFNYIWKHNRAGVGSDEPVKQNDHAMDCIRYPVYTRRSGMMFTPAENMTRNIRT